MFNARLLPLVLAGAALVAVSACDSSTNPASRPRSNGEDSTVTPIPQDTTKVPVDTSKVPADTTKTPVDTTVNPLPIPGQELLGTWLRTNPVSDENYRYLDSLRFEFRVDHTGTMVMIASQSTLGGVPLFEFGGRVAYTWSASAGTLDMVAVSCESVVGGEWTPDPDCPIGETSSARYRVVGDKLMLTGTDGSTGEPQVDTLLRAR